MNHWKAIQLGRYYVLLERGDQALSVLRHASPESADTWLWRANAMHLLSRYREGIESARCGLAIEPESSYLHHAVARAELMLGRLAEAEAAIVESLRLNPDEPEALALHALILNGRGKRQAAAKVAQCAVELAPEMRSVRMARAVTVPLDDEEAIRISRELLAAAPEGAPEHWWHAMNCVRRGRLRDAADHFARASALAPGNEAFARAARVARHWFFWPLRVTSPALWWLPWYSILPLLIFAASVGGVLWKVFWAAVTWLLYSFVYLLAQRHANRSSNE